MCRLSFAIAANPFGEQYELRMRLVTVYYPKARENKSEDRNRSDERLTLEQPALEFLYGGQITLPTLLINQTFVSTPHRHTTTISLEINPLMKYFNKHIFPCTKVKVRPSSYVEFQ